MKKQNHLTLFSRSFILLSALGFLSVSVMAIYSPQSVMDLVRTELPNSDAISSIRGVYGGVGFTIVISLLCMIKNHLSPALAFLSMLWGSYAASRMITIFREGTLGTFGNQWLVIESIMCIIALVLYLVYRKASNFTN